MVPEAGHPPGGGPGDVAQEAQEQGKGVEETARAMRYGFLTATAQELGADRSPPPTMPMTTRRPSCSTWPGAPDWMD